MLSCHGDRRVPWIPRPEFGHTPEHSPERCCPLALPQSPGGRNVLASGGNDSVFLGEPAETMVAVNQIVN